MQGDGDGNSEQLIPGLNSLEPCTAACLEFKKTNPGTNGITIGRGGCFCEQNMNAADGRGDYRSCILKENVKNATGEYTVSNINC